MKKRRFFILALWCLTISFAKANDLKINPYIQSHMVVQQEEPFTVWGTAAPSTTIKGNFDGEELITTTDAEGNWELNFKSRKASFDPKTLVVNNQTFTDILVGEVWICAGQSNMVWRIKDTDKKTRDIPADPAGYDGVRILHFLGVQAKDKQRGYTAEDLKNCTVDKYHTFKWRHPTRENVQSYSAISLRFGMDLRDQLDVPVGIITTAMGGSSVFCWIPTETVKEDPMIHEWFGKDWLSNPEVYSSFKRYMKLQFKDVLPDPPVFLLGKTQLHHWWEPGFLFDSSHKIINKAKVKGVIWYQGEADAINMPAVNCYSSLFRMMVQSWRDNYNLPNLPFINIQLPSFHEKFWPYFRSVQEKLTREDGHSYLVPIIDLGHRTNIHYPEKKDVSDRVVMRVLDDIYQKKDYAFPEIDSYQIKNGSMEIRLSDSKKPLKFSKETPAQIEVTYKNGHKESVDAELSASNKITIKVDTKSQVKAVRYAFKPYVMEESLIMSSDNIPLPPFEIKPSATNKRINYEIQ